jgi:hypothetical protein
LDYVDNKSGLYGHCLMKWTDKISKHKK